jgi:hypothetical protein
VNARSIVAIILALCVLVFVFSGTAMRVLWGIGEGGWAIDNAGAWRDLINVIIGALAGYIAGSNGDHRP